MGVYARCILPYLLHQGMRQERFTAYRHRLVREASGRVLEIGVGSGLNLPLYSDAVTSVVGLDPSGKLLSMAARAPRRASLAVRFVRGRAEALPLVSGSIDTVVTAWTMCSIENLVAATREVHRVLQPSGRWLFVEHGRAPDARVRRWQDWLTPAWRRVAGGCHLNRAIPALLEESGFQIERMESAYMQGPRIMTFMYEGVVRRREEKGP